MSSGARIRAAREAKGWTQGYLAHKLRVAEKTVSRWECDQTLPVSHLQERIALTLHVKRRVLFPPTARR